MEIRLKIHELLLVVLGLISIGITVGLTIAGIFSVKNGIIYSLMCLFPVLSIILRKKYSIIK
jgi:hypothetical protein